MLKGIRGMGQEDNVFRIWHSDVEHFVGKSDCSNCQDNYPRPHTTGYTNCGGLLHAEPPTNDDSLDLVICCDKCGDMDLVLSKKGSMFTAPELVGKLVDHQPKTGELTSVSVHFNTDATVLVAIEKLERKQGDRTMSFSLSVAHAKQLGRALLRASTKVM
jgi:ssDNA-binding Zn-finger/Zn-ribbon topoisomerase 1